MKIICFHASLACLLLLALPVDAAPLEGNGNVNFTVSREFTCYERVKLDRLNSSFRKQTLGDYGSIVVRALPRDDGGLIFITGALGETGKGSQSMRPMFDATPSSELEVSE